MMTKQIATPTPDIREHPAAYQLLSWGMIYPDAQQLTGLPDWLDALKETFAALEISTSDVEEALQGLPPNQAGQLQALQVEYTRLFINAVPSVFAPPYASAYSNGGQLMGAPVEAALQAYRSAGLTFLADDVKDLPDHLAAELEFMSYLSREELEARQSDNPRRAAERRRQRRAFLTHHLLPWIPAWRTRTAAHDRSGFYASLARLIEVWLQADAVSLSLE